MRVALAAGAIVALLLGGCMVGPDYQRPAVELPGGLSGRGAPVAPATAAATRTDWWTLFNDPS